MIDKAKAMKTLRSAITRFDKAAQAFSHAGSQDPEDAIEIKIEYKLNRKKLEDLIESFLDEASKH